MEKTNSGKKESSYGEAGGVTGNGARKDVGQEVVFRSWKRGRGEKNMVEKKSMARRGKRGGHGSGQIVGCW